MAKNLKLIWSNPNPKQKNAIQKFWEWLNKPHEIQVQCWWTTKRQKVEFLKSVLSNAFGDYDYQTETVGIYPALRAEDVVKRLEQQGLIDYYFDLYHLNQQHLQRVKRLKKKHKIA